VVHDGTTAHRVGGTSAAAQNGGWLQMTW
jgi:hypothetical protein